RELARVSPAPEGAGPARRAADHLGQVPGAGGGPGRVFPRGALAAVRGALVPQRDAGGADREGEGGGGAVEGDPRPGGPGGGAEEGGAGGGQAGGAAPGQGRRGGPQRAGRDAGLHELPARALGADPDEQPAGAAEPGDPAADAGGGGVPRRR